MLKKNSETTREDIILSIYNEMVHSSKLHHWKFMNASKDLLTRLIKLGVIHEKYLEKEE